VFDLTACVDGLRLGGELKATLDAERRWLGKMQELLTGIARVPATGLTLDPARSKDDNLFLSHPTGPMLTSEVNL